jgi:hypothetical protein
LSSYIDEMFQYEWLSSTQTITNGGENSGEKGTLIHCWWECKLVQPLWKAVWKFLKKLKIETSQYPAIPLLGICPKECAPGYDRATCIPMFIVALFKTAKLWKSPDAP